MVLYKRSGRFCPRISTLIIGFIQGIRGAVAMGSTIRLRSGTIGNFNVLS
ncbi:hypothetical protein [Paenibacillus polymyxa]|nr:hypothetical protein [Paenibacillus polymyxa]